MKEFKEVLPENNPGMRLVPQLLSNHSQDFMLAVRQLKEVGYSEVNLNAGCPSGTVTSKKKGAGMLTDTDCLDKFLYEIFEKSDALNIKISVKTRIGFYEESEFEKILAIYNQYPMQELIIHPRTREDYYKNHVRIGMFDYAVKESKNSLCYNGDIFSVSDYHELVERYHLKDNSAVTNIHAVMLGRGILKNPSVLENIIDGTEQPNWKKIFEFHDKLYNDYRECMSGETHLLFKMKEIWLYLVNSMQNSEKCAKKIKKIKNINEYNSVVREFRQKYVG